MKKVFILMLVVAATSCDNQQTTEKVEQTTVDSLPEGEWNGEYIEVKDSVADEKKPKRKSNGSEYYNMGKVEVTVDTVEFSIDLFDRRKNHITIAENSLSMRIKSAQQDYLSIKVAKPGIVSNYPGVYEIDPDGKKSMYSAIDFNRLSSENRMNVTMISGETTLESFSPRLGKVILTAEGTFKDRDGNTFPGKVNINMRFESVVSNYNPNS